MTESPELPSSTSEDDLLGGAVLHVDFCGEWQTVDPSQAFVIGREGDLAIDDNPYLHRAFLRLHWDRLWWLTNVGGQLAATVSDGDGALHAWLAPGASLPLVVAPTEVRFTAGATNYQITLHPGAAPLTIAHATQHSDGTTTRHPVSLTPRQRSVVLALAEPALTSTLSGVAAIPSSSEAASRLGWPQTTFNRQLDTVCQKLARAGVRGLHGDAASLASGRRGRLVEYALAIRLVTPEDLGLLDQWTGDD
jgi:hypothetical protein